MNQSSLKIFITIFLSFLIFPILVFAECATCAPSKIFVEKVVKTFAAEIKKNNGNFLLLRRVTQNDCDSIIMSDDMDVDKFGEMINGYECDFFEVLNSSKPTTKTIILFTQFSINEPTLDNPRSTSFAPKENSKWIFIGEFLPSNGLIKSSKLSRIKPINSVHGIISFEELAKLGISGEDFFNDIKTLTVFFQTVSMPEKLPILKTGLGKEILRTVLKLHSPSE